MIDWAVTSKPRAVPPPLVHVVDDDEAVRTAVVRLLRSAGHDARAYASAAEFVLAGEVGGPGCAVLDLNLPDASGLELQDALSSSRSPLPVVFLTGHGDVPSTVRAMKAGAVDFLTKPVNPDLLLKAVACALERDARRRATDSKLAELKERYRRLTPREREVFGCVVEGRLNKQIAGDLGASERTIKVHRARVMHKMGVRFVAQLVRAGEQLKTIPAAEQDTGLPLGASRDFPMDQWIRRRCAPIIDAPVVRQAVGRDAAKECRQ